MSILVMLIAVISSCDHPKEGANDPNMRQQNPNQESVGFIPAYANSEYIIYDQNMTDAVWDQQYRSLFIQAGQVIREFSEFIEHYDTTWVFADSTVRAALVDWEYHPFYYGIATNVSNRMLWYHFLGGSSYTDAQKTAMKFYVDMALKYHNPDSEMLAEALKILHQNDFWSTARIRTAADSAYTFAYEYLAVGNPNNCNCEDSTGSSSGYIQDALDAKSIKLSRMQSYMSVLDSLSNL